MAETHWARLQSGGESPLRRGAWYRVLSLTGKEAVVDVQGARVSVPRPSVEIRAAPPEEWTIIPIGDSRGPASLTSGYVVCPGCRHRVVLPFAHVLKLQCPRCNQLFGMDWAEADSPQP